MTDRYVPGKREILAEIEDVIRSMPPFDKLHWSDPDILAWLGRAGAAVNLWDPISGKVAWDSGLRSLRSGRAVNGTEEALLTLLYQAQNDLRMRTVGPVNLAIGRGYVFDYLDNVRTIIEQATADLLFVDRYLNGQFISTFLPFVKDGVRVRLLTRNDRSTAKNLAQLLVMASAFTEQHGTRIEIRSHDEHHERFVIVDGRAAFSSGSSFKDGPTTAGATIIQQSGTVLQEVLRSHDALWASAGVERAG